MGILRHRFRRLSRAQELILKYGDLVHPLEKLMVPLSEGDVSLNGLRARQTKENIRHSKKQRYVLEKMVEAGANYEERLHRIERQISLLFDTVHRQESLIKTKKDRHVSGNL